MATQPEDWIEWTGGECPVDPSISVTVKFRCGSLWPHMAPDRLDWQHSGSSGDIVLYRPTKMSSL